MKKKSILCFALAAGLAILMPFPSLRGDVPVYGRLQLRTERSGGADHAFLRLAARRMELLLRREKNKLPIGQTMVIHSDARQFQLKRTAGSWNLYLPGNSQQWKRDFQLRRQLYGALLAARLECRGITAFPCLSVWLTSAIDRSIANSQHAEQYKVNNGVFFHAAQFFRLYGRLPDFALLCTMEKGLLASSVTSVYDEFSLLLAAVLAQRKVLTTQIVCDLNGGAPDAWAEKFIGGAAKRQRDLERNAWLLIWNSSQPLPPELMKERIEALSDFTVPELDSAGKYTGKKLFCTPTETAVQLAQSNRKDSAALRRSFAVPWDDLARECDPTSRNLCRKIASSISLFGIAPQAPEEFSSALQALKKHIDKQLRQEALLNRTERDTLPVRRILQNELDLFGNSVTTLTTPEKIFLELSERDYLAD